MKRILMVVAGVVAIGAAAAGARQDAVVEYPIRPVSLDRVQITGGFWSVKLETNRTVTIPHIMRQNESTGRVDNFRKGAGLMPGGYLGRRFNDTDIYKIVEAASYSLISHPDQALSRQLDDLIALVAKSQQPDGYLFPARTIDPAKPAAGVGAERWQHENTGSHELYNSGHLYEAAVAHFQATGQRTLFDVALKNADLIVKTFGPNARRDAPGHEVIEMALVRLYGATRDRRYLDQAKFFVDERGTDHKASLDYTEPSWLLYNDRAYRQDDKPVVEQARAQGHAVRAVYLYSAMADIAALFRDPAYDAAIDRLWQDVVSKRMYLTGGLGTTGGTESFGNDYVLPNRSAYTETCASVGGLLWYHRMFLKSGDAKYLDTFEQTLYNGFLSGVSVQGDTFFYQNPLESTGRTARSAYFDVACCPANLSRLMAQLPGLMYATRGREVFVNLYADSTATIAVGGASVRVSQTTDYPWDGTVRLEVRADRAVDMTLKLRAPGWLDASPVASDLYTFDRPVTDMITVAATNGAAAGRGRSVLVSTAPGRRWLDVPVAVTADAAKAGTPTLVTLTLPMPVRRVLAHPGIADDAGKAAIQRGPIVYALEGIDNGGTVLDVSLPLDAAFKADRRADLLGGVTVLTTNAPAGEAAPRVLTAVPYYAWANRGRGEMVTWIRK